MMKRAGVLLLAAFFAAVSIFSAGVLAQELSTYSIDADLSGQSAASVKLILTFLEPVDQFDFLLPFRISNFTAESTSGLVVCQNQLDGVSLISCRMNLTKERKTIEIRFQSSDLVKPLQNGFIFTGDFSAKVPVKDVFVAIRLPEGMVLKDDVPGGATVPFSNSTSTDGRKITMLWRILDIGEKPLNFQVFYEPAIEPGPTFGVPPLRVLVLLAIIFGGGIGLIFFSRRRKTQEVVFSVLDDFEKRVISAIEKGGGTVNQKKIVLDTNLSKAKVSRVIKKLVERGLLEVERRGRTNIVKFVKKKLGF